MARHLHDRTNQFQAEPPKTPAPAATQPQQPGAAPPSISWGWQVAIFIWLASFAFLFLNDLLTIVFKFAIRSGG
jgi:hypothetical protein